MCEVTCRSAGHRVETKLLRLCQGDRNNPVLKRKRRMNYGVVLDIEFVHSEGLCKIISPQKRRKARVQANLGFAVYGEKLPVSPEALFSLFYLLSADSL